MFVFRNVGQAYARKRSFLGIGGSVLYGGRFNYIGTFGVLYLSLDTETCWAESLSQYDTSSKKASSMPRTIIGIEVELNKVLDLTNHWVLKRLGITRADLFCDWEDYQDNQQIEAPSQRIARLAREAGFEAIKVPSKAREGGRNLDIFPDNVKPPSRYVLINKDKLR